MIEREDRDGVAVLRLAHGPVNAIDLELLEAIPAVLDAVGGDGARAIVLTGTGDNFSAGADLFRVLSEGPDYVDRGQELLAAAMERLFLFPRPVVAAVNGNALAGGLILALACDHRILASGSHRVGLLELRVGLPFPTIALEVVRNAVIGAHLEEVVFLARAYPPEDALRLGLVDEVVEPAALMDRAVEIALRLAEVPAETYALTKRQLRQPVLDRAAREGPINDAEVARLWKDPATRGSAADFLEQRFGVRPGQPPA